MNGSEGRCDGGEGPAEAGVLQRHKQPQEIAMTGSKKSQPASPDSLAKTSPEAAVELSEAQLADASGGAIFMQTPAPGSFKFDGAHKIDSDPALLLPAVKPGN
jgi:hypothetical protein